MGPGFNPGTDWMRGETVTLCPCEGAMGPISLRFICCARKPPAAAAPRPSAPPILGEDDFEASWDDAIAPSALSRVPRVKQRSRLT